MFSGGSGRPYLVEGVGEDFFPAAWDPELYDEVIPISDEESFLTAAAGQPRVRASSSAARGGHGGRRRDPGRQAGRARRHRRRAQPGLRAAATCRASSTTSGWPTSASCASATQCVGAVLDTRGDDGRAALRQPRRTRCARRSTLMRANGISQLPVCKNTPPFANAEVSGSVDELDLMEAIARDPACMRHAGREGDGPEAADDRRRPDRSSSPCRCSTRRRRCWCCRAAARSRVLTRTDLLTVLRGGGRRDGRDRRRR